MDDALEPVVVSGVGVPPGTRRRIEVPVARLPTQTLLNLPVVVVNGSRPGPRLWLTAAVHGDEVNGVEVIREVLARIDPAKLAGAVVAVPVVNVFGFINQSRYLPDRRDLNRSFPGNAKGSLASRLAHLLMAEVVEVCTHGIDLHTGSNHRTNLPQVRGDLKDPETRRMAEAFGAPVVMQAATRDGSLREAATRLGMPVLLYEAGEPLRFNAGAIKAGVEGVLNVMHALEMRPRRRRVAPERPLEVTSSAWVRARRSGILRLKVGLGDVVEPGQAIGTIGDPFGESRVTVTAPREGLVVGHTRNPLVSRGDGIVHIGSGRGRSPDT